jgi:hypothetical protein
MEWPGQEVTSLSYLWERSSQVGMASAVPLASDDSTNAPGRRNCDDVFAILLQKPQMQIGSETTDADRLRKCAQG